MAQETESSIKTKQGTTRYHSDRYQNKHTHKHVCYFSTHMCIHGRCEQHGERKTIPVPARRSSPSIRCQPLSLSGLPEKCPPCSVSLLLPYASLGYLSELGQTRTTGMRALPRGVAQRSKQGASPQVKWGGGVGWLKDGGSPGQTEGARTHTKHTLRPAQEDWTFLGLWPETEVKGTGLTLRAVVGCSQQ